MGQPLIQDGNLDREAAAEALRHFLEEVVRTAHFELKATVRAVEPSGEADGGDAEVLADLDGRDKDLLLEHGAELLKAIEHLAFRALRLDPVYQEKIPPHCRHYPPPRLHAVPITR